MTIRLDRRQFLLGSTALAAAAGISPAFAQEALRLIFWGSQARADRTYGVTDLYAKAGGPDHLLQFLQPKVVTERF